MRKEKLVAIKKGLTATIVLLELGKDTLELFVQLHGVDERHNPVDLKLSEEELKELYDEVLQFRETIETSRNQLRLQI